MVILLAIVWAVLIGVLLFRAVLQYKHYTSVGARPWRNSYEGPRISVIVPARNEARTLPVCIPGLLQQDYPNFEVLVVNDNSTDQTGVVAREFEAADCRIKVVDGAPLQSGWAGKPHACWQGAHRANGEWLCFMDANTVAAPELLSAAVTLAHVQKFDMLSLEPFLELKTFWERVIIPSGLFLLAFTQDLRRVNDPNCPEAAASGQFILVRRKTYDSVCGHAAVRSERCEESALARLVKNSGGRMALLGAEGLIRTRMYDGLASLWKGLSKNVIEMVGGRAVTLLTAGLAVLIAAASVGFYFMAVWACLSTNVVTGADVAACEGALASTALFGMHIAGARHFRIPWWYGLLFPLGYVVAALIAMNSLRLRLRGEVTWKERAIHA